MLTTGINNTFKIRLITVELTVLAVFYYVIAWVLLPQTLESNLAFYSFVGLLSAAILYYLYISPTLHQDSHEARGIGSARKLFIRTDNFFTAWKLLFIPMLFIASLIILASWHKNTHFFANPDWDGFFIKFILYLASAFMQDILFFSYVLVRLKDLVTIKSEQYKKTLVVIIFAVLFATVHMPNLPLVTVTFIFALWLGYVFYTVANLYAIVIVHAILGTLLHRVYELHMKIGILYGTDPQQVHFTRFLIPAVNELIGNRW
ncbi:MAG: hypothetical protein U9R28_08320 [Pseudomonadota bacterium]|nr:hypothetical protein [Pseudomonadota bacterium]